jgi:hypothetical protein
MLFSIRTAVPYEQQNTPDANHREPSRTDAALVGCGRDEAALAAGDS